MMMNDSIKSSEAKLLTKKAELRIKNSEVRIKSKSKTPNNVKKDFRLCFENNYPPMFEKQQRRAVTKETRSATKKVERCAV